MLSILQDNLMNNHFKLLIEIKVNLILKIGTHILKHGKRMDRKLRML